MSQPFGTRCTAKRANVNSRVAMAGSLADEFVRPSVSLKDSGRTDELVPSSKPEGLVRPWLTRNVKGGRSMGYIPQ